MAEATGRAPRWAVWIIHAIPALMLLAGGWIAGCSCEEDAGDFALGSDPRLEVTPESLSFAAATTESPETLSIVVTNAGTGPLRGFTFRLQKNEGPFTVGAFPVTELADGESAPLTVTYKPDDEETDDDVLIIEANNNQRAEIPLLSLPPRRELQCDPAVITFAGGQLGDSVTETIRIANIGTLPATITGFDLEDGLEVSVTEEPPLALVLAPEETTELTMTFTPQFGGMSTDSLRIITEEAPGIFTCAVRNTVSLPLIQVTPARVDFGAVEPGEAITADIVVENVGAAPLLVEPPAFLRGGSSEIGFVEPPTETTELAPGDQLSLTARYVGGTSVASATAVLASNDPTNPQAAIPMLGRPALPDLSVSPPSIDFGNVGRNQTSTRTLTLFNNGSEPLSVTSLTVLGSAELKIEPNNAFAPTTGAGEGIIAPETSVEVQVSFEPVDLGQETGLIAIESNDPDESTLNVPLTGNGLVRGACEVEIRPDPLNFGLVARGTVKTLTASVANVGGGACTFADVEAAGVLNSAFGIDGTSVEPGATFGPGQVLQVEVRYAPTTNEFNAGRLTLDITDPDSNDQTVFCNSGLACQQNPMDLRCAFMPPPCSIELQGFSGPASIAVIPGSLDFGLVTLGCASQTSTVSIYNTGTEPIDLIDVRLDDTCTGEFELRGTPGPPWPVEIAPSAAEVVQVVYRPEDLGSDACSLIVESNASDTESILRVPLEGEGTNTSQTIDVFEQVSGREVDVIFVIDPSGSMSDEQDNVAANLDSFLATAEVFNNNFQIGVTHLDLGDAKWFGGELYAAGELMGSPPFVTRDHPDYVGELRRRIRMGASGGGPEAGLGATQEGFSDPHITEEGSACTTDDDCEAPYGFCGRAGTCGGRNAGFIRDNASLEVVIISDEEDQSPATPDFYIQFFQSLKGFRNEALLHVSTIIGADVVTNEPAPCMTSDGGAQEGRRYGAVAEATGGTIGSICAADFSPFLQNIGNRAFGLRREFFLSRAAEPATVEVRVDGVDVENGWTYDPATNSVIFERDTAPQPGSTIEVEYEARCFE